MYKNNQNNIDKHGYRHVGKSLNMDIQVYASINIYKVVWLLCIDMHR